MARKFSDISNFWVQIDDQILIARNSIIHLHLTEIEEDGKQVKVLEINTGHESFYIKKNKVADFLQANFPKGTHLGLVYDAGS